MHINISNNEAEGYSLYNPQDNFLVRGAGWVGDTILKSKIFNVLTLGSAHTLVHELGHAVAY